jgi:hypothetical protein
VAARALADRLQTEVVSLLRTPSRACFSGVDVCVLALSPFEDNRLIGSRLLLEHVMRTLQSAC